MPTPKLRAINWALVGLLLVTTARTLYVQSLLTQADRDSLTDRKILREQVKRFEVRRDQVDSEISELKAQVRALKARLEAEGR